jgi:hypothetical protein
MAPVDSRQLCLTAVAQFPETGERPVCPQVCFLGQQDCGKSFLRLGNCCLLTRQAQSTLMWGAAEKSLPSRTFVDPANYLFTRKIISVPLSRKNPFPVG